MVDPRSVRDVFMKRYGSRDPGAIHLFRAPGRVNLIGEHTDYNDGFVLPVAIDRDTVIAARGRNDSKLEVYSVNRESSATVDLSHDPDLKPHFWMNYVEGVARVLKQKGFEFRGADMVVTSDVPTGAGLSSSAALEISSAFALLGLAGLEVDPKEIALAGQQAEHEYVGTMCGIMDQFISTLGRKSDALLIDCRTLEASPIPVDTSEKALVICNSGVKHDLASSAYNDRRHECEEAVRELARYLPGITALRDVSVEEFNEHADKLSEVLQKRARHVVTENDRTLRMATALRNADYAEITDLMYASHVSLRDDYEVSAPELDILVEEARGLQGVFGSRMTGGGFGGCTVNFVERETLDEFNLRMKSAYKQATNGRDLVIYNCEIVQGAEEIKVG